MWRVRCNCSKRNTLEEVKNQKDGEVTKVGVKKLGRKCCWERMMMYNQKRMILVLSLK